MTATPNNERWSSNELGHPGSTGETAVQGRPRRSIPKALRVTPCLASVVRPLMAERHYLHSMPGVVRDCFAVELDGELVGGVVFTAGARHAHHLLQGAVPQHVVTLARLWLCDELPANSESRVLGVVLRHLVHGGRYKLALSYADPAAGHVGTIYQASGWTYLGTTEPERYFELDGVRIHPRTASQRFGSNSIAHLRRTGLAIVAHKSPPKHRYAYVLDPAWRWRLRGVAKLYPKRGGRGPPPRRSAQREMACGRRQPPTGQKPTHLRRHVMTTTTEHHAACQRRHMGGES